MSIRTIRETILDEASSPAALRDALDAFCRLCAEVTGIWPDRSFDAWAGDALLESGVAINPRAAAHCVVDYQRSVVFIRGVQAALNALRLRFPETPLQLLYAGCGPYATLLLPLLGQYSPGALTVQLLDFHQRSLDSVKLLLDHFGLSAHDVQTIKADACCYQHPQSLHLVIAEVMQKSLEQEPQFAVTANLAPQLCPGGVFIPQRIEVSLCVADLQQEEMFFRQTTGGQGSTGLANKPERHLVDKVLTLSRGCAKAQLQHARARPGGSQLALEPVTVAMPSVPRGAQLDAALFTQIRVFEGYELEAYDSEITLPLKCHELSPIVAGARYTVTYQLGSYPTFNFENLGQGA